ncbi:MAG TPA: 3-phosphoshikimate 1-carboxyvinyltransferase [Gammaproteobacteria bacterium]|nr:3-phosphoshikimate 1-carboxyvinyltransferase [Gammaproteobacteria bacterium]
MTPVAATDYHVSPGGRLSGNIRVPGDKSISHRALMLGAIAKGRTTISDFLEGEDTLATLHAFREMGVKIDHVAGQKVVIHGVGLHGLRAPATILDLGNSGTSVRLLAGLLAGQSFDTELTGDPSLQKRPMRRITEPLQLMHASIQCSKAGTLPISIRGGQRLQGIHYNMSVASAQLKSCLLLAGLYANGETCVREPSPTRDHTERMLGQFGYAVKTGNQSVCLAGGGRLQGTDVHVPADISSAAFFIVGASIAEDSELLLERVGLNPTRDAVIGILQSMGADIRISNRHDVSGEPAGDIRVRSASLHGVEIPPEQVPYAIDEFPAIMIAAAAATGETRLSGAEELRVKESDRIAAITDGLQALGIDAEAQPGGLRVTGGPVFGGTVNSFGDHRVAMAFAMAGLVAREPVVIRDCANVDTSFPGFVTLARDAGLGIETGGADDK